MASFVTSWKTTEFMEEMDKAVAKGVGRAAQFLARRIKERISRPGVKKTTPFGSTRVRGKRVRRGTAGGDITRVSRPGEPPRKRLGMLRNSIRAEKHNRTGTVYRVGSKLRYAAALELGTSRGLKPRPYLRSTLAQERLALRNAILTGIKGTKFLRPLHGTPSSSELTTDDVDRGRSNVHFAEPPDVGEL